MPRYERVVPYSASTGALLAGYLRHRATISRARGPLFLPESRRNHGQPLTLWSWSKIVRRLGLAADLPRFATHTTRHLCLTDLARMGWELHTIASFAGHRSTESTMKYIHLSGRDLADKLARGMEQIHAWRIAQLAQLATRSSASLRAPVRWRRRRALLTGCSWRYRSGAIASFLRQPSRTPSCSMR
ncbi:site-specific integrase [Nonomuraea sp. B19D2]|uniref:site-specific integrase n=1 Tax=Nonomuraea sp. B19D2 TaxID=3159561 RepID=UPI0032DA36AA